MHSTPVVRGGGVAPLVVCMATVTIFGDMTNPLVRGVILAGGLLGLVGFLEDTCGIGVSRRLALQSVICVLASVSLLQGSNLSGLWWVLAGAAIALWIVALTNVYNFMDGINGLSAIQAVAVSGTWLWASTTFLGLDHLEPLLASVGASMLGFLPFNFPRARLFLGDTGSYFLGGWFGALGASTVLAGVPPLVVLAPLSLYIADTSVTLTRRLLSGDSVHLPHKTHGYQKLVARGWSHARVCLTLLAGLYACTGFAMFTVTRKISSTAGYAGISLVALIYVLVSHRTPRTSLNSASVALD